MRISDWSSDVCSSDLRVKASAVAPAKPAMTLFLPRRRTLRALDFITVLPKLTWPSPATTTWLPLRTERIVVPCHWRGEFSDMDCQMGKSGRSEEHTSELKSLMSISYAGFCLKKKNRHNMLTK